MIDADEAEAAVAEVTVTGYWWSQMARTVWIYLLAFSKKVFPGRACPFQPPMADDATPGVLASSVPQWATMPCAGAATQGAWPMTTAATRRP